MFDDDFKAGTQIGFVSGVLIGGGLGIVVSAQYFLDDPQQDCFSYDDDSNRLFIEDGCIPPRIQLEQITDGCVQLREDEEMKVFYCIDKDGSSIRAMTDEGPKAYRIDGE